MSVVATMGVASLLGRLLGARNERVGAVMSLRRLLRLAFAFTGVGIVPVGSLAEGQMTIFNSHALAKFESCSIQVNRFDIGNKSALSRPEILKVCESLDNSRFCYFGSLFDREHRLEMYAPLFDNGSIRQSLTDFLHRGGMIYFAPVTRTQFAAWPQAMKAFFRDVGAPLPDEGNYENNVLGSESEQTLFAQATPKWRDSFFNTPRPVDPIQSIRHFKGVAELGFETVYATKEGFPVVISAKTKIGGAVVFSHVYNFERQQESPFYLNMLEGLYGKDAARIRSSRAVYVSSAHARGKRELYVREEPVYSKVYADTPVPDGGEELTHVDLLLARGDRELAKIVFYNCSEENLVFRVEPSADRTNADIFRFYDVQPWRTETGPVVNEIVVPINEAALVNVPSGETRVLLLAGETMRRAGTYGWAFELVPCNLDAPTRRITVRAEVLDLTVDPDCLPTTYMWGPYEYSFSAGRIETYREFLVGEKRVSMIQTSGHHWDKLLEKGEDGKIRLVDCVPPDLISEEVAEKKAGRRWVNGYGLLGDFWRRMEALGGKPDVTDPVSRELFEDGVRMIDAEFRKAGITPDDFYEPLRDEPSSADIPQLLVAGKIVRSLGWKVCIDVATWCTMDDIRAFEPVVDWWQPWERRLVDRATGPEEIAYYRSTGKKVSPYLCSESGNTDPYLKYHRFRGIRSYMMGYDGFGTWAANSWRGNDYRGKDNALDGRNGSPGSFYVHHSDVKPVGTMRLEAWREGAEDFHWLKYAERHGLAEDFRTKAALEKLNAERSPVSAKAWRDGLLRAMVR